MNNLVNIKGEGGLFGGEAAAETNSNSNIDMVFAMNAGVIGGSNDWAKNIYINSTVLENANGARNFDSVAFETRMGHPSQTAFDGYNTQEATDDVSTTVVVGVPVVRTITTANSTHALVTLVVGPFYNAADGARRVAETDFKIEVAASGGGFNVVKSGTIKLLTGGSVSSDYEFALTGSAPWQIRVTKTGDEHDTLDHKNTLTFGRLTRIEAVSLSHDGVALLKLNFNADEIGSQPQVFVKAKLQEIPVPNNYNAGNSTYSSNWNGGFTTNHTTNPVWLILYLLRSTQDGLGLTNTAIDMAAFMATAQYCDELIDNGNGGLRKRFTFNGQLNEIKDWWKLLQEIAAIFHGRLVGDAVQISLTDDRPVATKILVSSSNVIDGEFRREIFSKQKIVTSVEISWNDPNNNGKKDIEIIEDASLVAKYGRNKLRIHRLACTNQQEAVAHARWRLEHEKHNFSISYRAALDHLVANGIAVAAGDVVAIANEDVGGRLLEVSTNAVKLDRKVVIEFGKSYELWVTDEDGFVSKGAIALVAGEHDDIILAVDAFVGAQWQLICDDNATLMRVVSVVHNDGIVDVKTIPYDGELTARAEAAQVLAAKTYEQRYNAPLKDLLGVYFKEEIEEIDGAESFINGLVSVGIDSEVGLNTVEFQQKTGDGNWRHIGFNAVGMVEVYGLKIGETYAFRARATGRWAQPGNWVEIDGVEVYGRPNQPAAPTSLVAAGGANNVTLNWVNADVSDFKHVILYMSETINFAQASEYTQTSGNWFLAANLEGEKTYYFWARTVVRGDGSNNASLLTPRVSATTQSIAVIVDVQIDAAIVEAQQIIDDNLANAVALLENADTEAGDALDDAKTQIAASLASAVAALEDADGDAVTAIIDIQDVQESGISAELADLLMLQQDRARLAQTIGRVSTAFGDSHAAILEVALVAAQDDKALAQKIENLGVETGNNAAEITSFKQVVTTQDGANATAINSLQANIDDNAAEISITNEAFVDNIGADLANLLMMQQDRVSLAQTIGKLATSFGDSHAAILEVGRVAVQDDKALAQKIENLTVDIGNTTAEITSFKQAVATKDSSTSLAIDNLAVSVGDNASQLTSFQQTVATQDGANATAMDTLQVTVDENASEVASVTFISSVQGNKITGLEAGWAVQAETPTGIGKFRIYVVGNDSFAEISADFFKITQPGGGRTALLEIVDNQIKMPSAFIGDITIDKLTGGTLGANMVLGSNGEITIGNDMRIDKYGVYIG